MDFKQFPVGFWQAALFVFCVLSGGFVAGFGVASIIYLAVTIATAAWGLL